MYQRGNFEHIFVFSKIDVLLKNDNYVDDVLS